MMYCGNMTDYQQRCSIDADIDNKLRQRIQRIMRILRACHPWPEAQYSEEGYFRVPVNIAGRLHYMPLGFIGTSGCNWARNGGCTMCDYGGFEGTITDAQLVRQASKLLDLWKHESEINLSSLGSFFDDRELSSTAREAILREVAKREHINLIGVESRAADVTREKIQHSKAILRECCFEVGMGFESKNDFIRNVCINKGLSLHTFERSVKIIVDEGAHAVGHVLFKPPFITESEAIDDAIETIEYLNDMGVRRIVLMVCNVKKGTLVYELYNKGIYRPPWLWSILKTILSVSKTSQKKLLIYGFKCGLPLVAVGSNCPDCDNYILRAIESFCGTSDITPIIEAMSLKCRCKEKWLKELQSQPEVPLPLRVQQQCKLIETNISQRFPSIIAKLKVEDERYSI